MDRADALLRELQDLGVITRSPDLAERKRKEPTNAAVPSVKRRKNDFGAEAGIITYLVQPTNGLYEGALYDHVIDAAKLLPADVVLEPATYWFVSPIELEIQRSPLIQLYDSIQYKEYYLYRVSAAANGHAEFYDTSGNLYAQVEWFFNYGNPSEESLSRVQDTLGGNDSSSKSDAVRQDMWNKFTQTDQYKQLTNNSDGNINNISYGYSPPSFTELPDSLKFLVRNDTKATQRPQSTTATHQSGGYNTTASHQSGIYNYPPASNSRATHQSGPLPSSGSQIHRSAENNLDNSNRNGHHIPFSQIKQGKFIGEGTFGRIYFAEYNNQTYAIKQFKNYVDNKEEALNEVTAYMKLRHKQIVSLVGITTDPQTDEIMLVMEYMENGSLHDLLAREKVQLSREAIIRLGLDIAKGVHFLHSQKIMHRDLKSANVLLYDNKKRAKLSDFGAARIFENSSKTSTVKGTLGFMAPEVLNEEKPYSYQADVYSFGVLLYHMLTLTIPPMRFKDLAHVSTLIKEQVKDLKFQELIIHCCTPDPNERLSINDCIGSLVNMQYEIKP